MRLEFHWVLLMGHGKNCLNFMGENPKIETEVKLDQLINLVTEVTNMFSPGIEIVSKQFYVDDIELITDY